MADKPRPPQWPEQGEDVQEIDPFTLNDGDRIFILGQGNNLVGALELGPWSNNDQFRYARLISPAGTTRREVRLPKWKLPIKVGQPYCLEPATTKQRKPIAMGRVHFIRVVRAKPTATPEPTTSPANP